jgi:hypothetical protein
MTTNQKLLQLKQQNLTNISLNKLSLSNSNSLNTVIPIPNQKKIIKLKIKKIKTMTNVKHNKSNLLLVCITYVSSNSKLSSPANHTPQINKIKYLEISRPSTPSHIPTTTTTKISK